MTIHHSGGRRNARENSGGPKEKPPVSERLFGGRIALLDLVYAIAGLGLCGLDLEAVLLGGGREEAPNAVGLPIRGFFWVAPFFEDAFSGATVAPCSATVAGFSVAVASALVMVVNPFCAFLRA